MINLAQSIKERRRILKITQKELSQISGVSLRSLKQLESGKGNPTWNQVYKILEVLGWDLKLSERVQ
ncbi:MAG: helix-turn-helix domain-containing protein [Fibrobacterota bacterium]|nr:helix-turn-helix domain-containing protein [Fibrobacterota bacterium]